MLDWKTNYKIYDNLNLMKVILVGATGFIGRVLIPRLMQEGYTVTAWVRNTKTAAGLPCEVEAVDFSDPETLSKKMAGAHAVVNLAGEPISQTKWTPEFKVKFLASRTTVTRSLVTALNALPADARPKLLVNASAIGFYGDRGDEVLNEASTLGSGYLADVCRDWEAEASKIESKQVRTVLLRIGIVLGRSGGMLSKLLPVRLGSGHQWMSWIHVDDLVEMILFSIKNESVRGAVNGVGPNPATQAEMNQNLSEKMGVPYLPMIGVPEGALKLATGELANVVLASQRCVPEAMIKAGFHFRFPDLNTALADLIDGCQEWVSWQVVQRPLPEVFSFFGKAENLEVLTPTWLNFKILAVNHPDGEMAKGSVIDYSLKIHGVPVKWRTLIAEWVLNRKFIDTQVRGPYQVWHHTHEFFDLGGKTLMLDRVRYRLPLGKLGRLVAGNFVDSDIQTIFEYRNRKITELLN